MSQPTIARLCFGLWMLFAATLAFANGVFQTVTGDVKTAIGTTAPIAVVSGQRIVAGSTVTTGPKALTVIRFDDGHTIALNENTEFRINDYSFDKDKPQSDNMAIELFKGAMRSVSGLLGSRNQSKYALAVTSATTTATIGIRGTDFMVAMVNPVYFSVIVGNISVASGGTLSVLGPGFAFLGGTGLVTTSIAASALPASVAASFNSLGSLAIGAGAGAAGAGGGAAGSGAGGAVGAAGGGLGVAGGIGLVGAAAAALSAISSANKSDDAIPSTSTATGTP